MTEIPEHLRKRAEQAREKAANIDPSLRADWPQPQVGVTRSHAGAHVLGPIIKEPDPELERLLAEEDDIDIEDRRRKAFENFWLLVFSPLGATDFVDRSSVAQERADKTVAIAVGQMLGDDPSWFLQALGERFDALQDVVQGLQTYVNIATAMIAIKEKNSNDH